MDVRNLKRAWKFFGAYAETKHECNRLNETLDTMKSAADQGLEVTDLLGSAVAGTFDRQDAEDSFFLGINMAPRIDPRLWDRIPWRFKKPTE